MKKSVILLLILMSGTISLKSQIPQIIKQYEETSYTLRDICFTENLTGFASGFPHWDQNVKAYTGTIIKTTDGGETWFPLETGTTETLNKIYFSDTDNGWSGGTNGTILHTTDAGNTWTKQSVATTDEIRAIKFINNTTGWITTIKPVHYDFQGDADDWRAAIWKTTDSGSNWIKQTISDSTAILNGIDFIDALNGWTAGIKYYKTAPGNLINHIGSIYHTTNGGLTWTEQKVPKPPAPAPFGDSSIIFTDVDFISGTKGFVTGFKGNSAVEGGNIYFTTDGGITWIQDTNEATQGVFKNLWDIDFIDNTRGYAVGTLYGAAWGPPVLRTTDGGITWEIIQMEHHDGEGLYCVSITNERVVALGDNDFLCISEKPWDIIPQFWEESLFRQNYINPHYFFEDIVFANENQGWATGKMIIIPDSAQQIIMHTSDGGNNWIKQYVSETGDLSGTPRLNKISFIDSLTGWVFGGPSFGWEKGHYILHTTNGGVTWITQDATIPDSKRELYSGYFINSTTGWAMEKGGIGKSVLTLLKTTDGGINWNRVNTGITGMWGVGYGLVQGDIFFTDSQNGWAGGYYGGIIHTTDGGVTWVKQNYPQYSNCNTLWFINNSEGWTADAGVLQHTTDGGNTWSELSLKGILSGYPSLNDLHFENTQNGWVVGDNGIIIHTTNGGTSWNNYTAYSTTFNNLLGLHFVNDTLGWAAGSAGVILRINNGKNTLPVQEIPLSKQMMLYPNPASDIIVIEIPENEKCRSLSIEDTQRRQVINQSADNSFIQVNIHNLPNGVYFIKLITDKGVRTERFVKL